MVLHDADDHAAFWAHDVVMRAKTEAYRKKVVKSLGSKLLKKETEHPWTKPETTVDWRIRIFEIAGNRRELPDRPVQFDSPRDMLMYWEDTLKDGSDKTTNRRVIVLEDVNPRLAELLGVLLDIPPEYFLSHCDNQAELSVVNASGAKQGSSTYWKVPIPQRRTIPRDFNGPYGKYNIRSGTFNRGEQSIHKEMKSAKVYSYVSYWGTPYGDDSWTDVILVDSKKLYMHESSSSSSPKNEICLDNWIPIRDVCHEVILGSTRRSQPYGRSMFGAISEMHNNSVPTVSEDPFSGTTFARNYIYAVWEEHVIRMEGQLYEVVFKDPWRSAGYGATDSSPSLADLKDENSKVVRHYQKLMEKRRSIHETRKFLRDVMWKFHCDDAELVALERNKSLRRSMMQESRQWRMLDKKIEYMHAAVEDQMKVYSQRAAMEEAFATKVQAHESSIQTAAANRTARISGQLIKIAVIIAPCMFVAVIFSMIGKFAFGEPLFFIYWGVSIVLSCALLAWVLYTDIVVTMKETDNQVNNNRSKPVVNERSDIDEPLKAKSKFSLFRFKQNSPSLSEENAV